MKAVIYHADAAISLQFPKDTYKNLILGLKKNCNSFSIPLIHLTVNGFEGLGDENFFYDGDPADVIYNREKFFIEFLKHADDDVYWFTEPDSRINNMFPELNSDLALLIRNHPTKKLTPAWRLAKKSAVPFFEEALSYYDNSMKDWHGDTAGFRKMWENIGRPETESLINYKNISIELRSYKSYCMRKSVYTQQFKSNHKSEILERESKT